jgi:hypothetical protein
MASELEVYKKAELEIPKAQGIYLSHQLSTSKAKEAVEKLVQQVSASGMNEDIYKNAAGLVDKIKKTVTKFKEERAPITRTVTDITKAFTSQESELDALITTLKAPMDKYVQELERKRREEEEKRQKQIQYEREVGRVTIEVASEMKKGFLSLYALKKVGITTAVRNMTLDSYNEVFDYLKTYNPNIQPIVNFPNIDTLRTFIEPEKKAAIVQEMYASDEYEQTRQETISNLKMFANEQIPILSGLRDELQNIELSNRTQRDALLRDKQIREQQQDLEIQKEVQEKSAEIVQEEIQGNQANEMASLFEVGASIGSSSEIKVAKSFLITVDIPQGLPDIFSFWLKNLEQPIDEKKIMAYTVARMIAVAEKEAKNGTFIKSNYVHYEEQIKSK